MILSTFMATGLPDLPARQDARAGRAVGQQAHLLAPAHLRDLVFEAAREDAAAVLDRLVADETVPIRHPQALHEPVRALVAAADRAHLALLDQAIEGLEGDFDGNVGVGPVRLVEVDVVRAESLQARFDGALDVVAIQRRMAGTGPT